MALISHTGRDTLKWRKISLMGAHLVEAYFSTMRIEAVGFEKIRDLVASRRFIAAMWHSRFLIFSYVYKGFNCAVIVSRSADGQIIAGILERQGHVAVRGSSKKGGQAALEAMIEHLLAHDRPAVFTPDGPQGPRGKVKPGVITIAQRTGLPIIPVCYSARRINVFPSWDRFILPFPFTACRVIYGEPLFIPAELNSEDFALHCNALEEELNRITRQADRHFNHVIT